MGLILPSVNNISLNVLCFKLRQTPSLSSSYAPVLNYCVVLPCCISLRFVNLNKPLHLLGISSLTYNIDTLEMSSFIDIGVDHLGYCLTTDISVEANR